MKTTTPITGALVVIVAAAGVAVGALALDAGGSPAPASTSNGSATTVQAPAANADSSTGDGYGSDTPAANTDTGNGNGAATASPSANASSATLEISGFAFGSVSVAPGGKVTVQNQDSATHTVTADEGGFDTGQLAGGSSTTFTAPTTPGTYKFHCDIHPDMTGTLTVG